MRHALTAEFDAALRVAAQSLAAQTEQKRGGADLGIESGGMPQYDRAGGAEVFLLRTAGGREIARSRSLGTSTLPLRAGSLEAPDFFEAVLPGGRVMRCAGVHFVPQSDEGEEHPGAPKVEALLIVGRDRESLDRTLAAVRGSLLLVGTASLALLALAVRWGVRTGLAPLERLGQTIAAVKIGSGSIFFPLDPLPSELRPIAERMNALFARTEEAFERERRFTATAAHEFRTPLAELRALAEVNLTTPSTDQERVESWRDALAATLRMESLAVRLLELTRAEYSPRLLYGQFTSLPEAVASAWDMCGAEASARGVILLSTLPSDLQTKGDPVALGVILGNLCANAAAHAPAGTPLHVTCTREADGVTLLFLNRQGDLTVADMPHLFERFWRKDTARSDSHHYGLGLALAAEFAELLGGTITARLCPDGWFELALRLPDVTSK